MTTLAAPTGNEIQNTLAASYTRGTDTTVTLTDGTAFPSSVHVIRIESGAKWCLKLYESKATHVLTLVDTAAGAASDALAKNVTVGDEAYEFPIGSTVELVESADEIAQLFTEQANKLDEDGSVPLTADWDAGSYNIRAVTLTPDGLTAERVVFTGANGLLSEEAALAWITASSRLDITKTAIGATQGDYGIALKNTTAAASGAQQYSPPMRWKGYGWKTDATAASQSLEYRVFAKPVEGAAAPSVNLLFQYSIDGGAYVDKLELAPGSTLIHGDSVYGAQMLMKGITTPNKQLYFGYSTTSGFGNIQAIEQTVGYKPLSLNTDGGNVGVKDSSPSYGLEVNGTFHCTGALSKGSGTFLIDHPLFPEDKKLYHGFVEAPRYDLLYRGVVKLVGGMATVDIDSASNMTEGTFSALCQNCVVTSLQNQDGFSRCKPLSIIDGKFTIECEDSACTDEIAWVVMAERKDQFILEQDGSDDEGHLLVEVDKEAPTETEMESLNDLLAVTDEGPSERETRVDTLKNKKGYRMHAERPTRKVCTITKEEAEFLGVQESCAITEKNKPILAAAWETAKKDEIVTRDMPTVLIEKSVDRE